ncbi:MAG TPA: hypothetical protein PKA05_08460 [Roseiflexaceae bacterium]|nr:hypothetical protein [Roseiflexaceae bacterium]
MTDRLDLLRKRHHRLLGCRITNRKLGQQHQPVVLCIPTPHNPLTGAIVKRRYHPVAICDQCLWC